MLLKANVPNKAPNNVKLPQTESTGDSDDHFKTSPAGTHNRLNGSSVSFIPTARCGLPSRRHMLARTRRIYPQDRAGSPRLVRHMRQAPGVKFIMPTFNPETHPFEDQPIWLRVTKAGMHEPETVACMAARCFNTQDYHQLLASGVLWFHDGKKPSGFLLDTPGPSGVISHVGGLWVHPDNRGDGLSWIVPRLLGAVTLSAWHQEYHTGLVQEGLVGKGVPGRNYGVGSMDLCIDGWFEPTNRHERIYSAITTRTEMLERMSIDLDQIVRESDKKVRDHAPVTRHRNH